MRIFDSHAHYDDPRFESEYEGGREAVLPYVFSQGVEYIVNVGATLDSSEKCIELAAKYPQIYASVGIHPNDCGRRGTLDEEMEMLERLISRPKVAAIGETGMDFHYDEPSEEIQRKWFIAQAELARRTGLPLIVHDREAHGACMDVVRGFPDVRGVFHSYSGSAETADELVRRGWMISFSGVITFKNAARMARVVESVPLDRIMVETDCPYLAPHPLRGSLNNSANLVYTIGRLAELKGISSDEAAEITFDNARRFYGI